MRCQARAHQVQSIAGWLCVLAGALTGCGDGQREFIPVRGQVFYNGQPMSGGTVHYTPSDVGEGQQASGGIQSDGQFEMTTRTRGDGVKPGRYRISVYAMAPHPGEPKSREEIEAQGGRIVREFLIPERYTVPETSGLEDVVDENHSGNMRIELTD